MAPTSSRGLAADPSSWPDVSAPGSSIVSTCRMTMPICENQTGPPNSYATLTGTSMSAPHVTGIVAQLLQANPKLTPAQVEEIIEDTAHKFRFGLPYGLEVDPSNPDDRSSPDKGHGLIDAVKAVQLGFHPPDPSPLKPIDLPTVQPGLIPPEVDLNDVSFPTRKLGWAVGEGGAVFATSDGGGTWVRQKAVTGENLQGIDFVDASYGWAVGNGNTVLSTSTGGRTWKVLSTGLPAAVFQSVEFVDRDRGWAVGSAPLETGCCAPVVISTTDGGATWSPQAAPAPSGLTGVSFLDHDRGAAVGFFGAAFRTEDGGGTWVPMPVSTGASDSFSDVEFTDPQNGIVTAGSGAIFATQDGGLTWTPVADFGGPVRALAVSGRAAIAVGSDGLLAMSSDAGSTWAAAASDTGEELRGVSAPSARRAVAVGTRGFATAFPLGAQ
ncbi:MAG: YCF48-related protein, partial [Actinomycetota bacterium]